MTTRIRLTLAVAAALIVLGLSGVHAAPANVEREGTHVPSTTLTRKAHAIHTERTKHSRSTAIHAAIQGITSSDWYSY